MATTINELKDWFVKGQNTGATHMIIICDTWDWIDKPIYVTSEQDARQEFIKHKENAFTKVMEVYNLKKDINNQLNKHRAMEF